jgi:hypothetical protein
MAVSDDTEAPSVEYRSHEIRGRSSTLRDRGNPPLQVQTTNGPAFLFFTLKNQREKAKTGAHGIREPLPGGQSLL